MDNTPLGNRDSVSMIIPNKSSDVAESLQRKIENLVCCTEGELVQRLNGLLEWNKPRGDLVDWIALLNRFDDILERMVTAYHLEEPQLSVMSALDVELVLSCVKFTTTLITHCTSGDIYDSKERLYCLLNTPTIEVRLAVLELAVAVGLCQRISLSKEVKKTVLQITRSFPPLVPQKFKGVGIIGEHLSYFECMKQSCHYPKEWEQLDFKYYSKGLSTFSMNKITLKKLSIEQIFDKAMGIPKEYWVEFGLAAYTAKSFNSKSYDSVHLRHQLLQVKLMALSLLVESCNEGYVSSRVFEMEPYIFNFLSEMILPAAMEELPNDVYLASAKTLGVMATKISWNGEIARSLGCNINNGMIYQTLRVIHKKLLNDDANKFERGYIYIFNLIESLVESPTIASRAASGGLLNELLNFLKEPSKYWWHASAVSHLLIAFIPMAPDLMDEFVNNNGFQLLIDTLDKTTSSALQAYDPPEDSIVFYSINFRQANFLLHFIDLISFFLRLSIGDRLRNLFDSSLLQTFNRILNNPSTFGSLILAKTITAVFFIIHNEPTSFDILKEANVIDTIVTKYHTFLYPDSTLIFAILEILGAIALNKEGLKLVIDNNCIQTFFSIFRDVRFRKNIDFQLSASMEDLGKYYDEYKPIIISELKKLMVDIPKLVNKHINGIKYFEDDEKLVHWHDSDYGVLYDSTVEFLFRMASEIRWNEEIVELIKSEEALALLDIDNAPYDIVMDNFTLTNFFSNLNEDSDDAHFIEFCEYLKRKVSTPVFQEFLNFEGPSYFNYITENPEACTRFLKQLNSINMTMVALCADSFGWNFMSHERYKKLAKIFGTTEGLEFMKNLGLLLKRVIMEESYLRDNVEEDILIKTTPTADVEVENPKIRVFMIKDQPQTKSTDNEPRSRLYKNVLQLRYFCFQIIHSVSDTFAYLGKIGMHRRQDYSDIEIRRNVIKITIEVGNVFSSLADNTEVNYMFVLTRIIKYMIHQREERRNDIQTSLVISFLQSGLLKKLEQVASSIKDVEVPGEEVIHGAKGMRSHLLANILSIFEAVTNSLKFPNLPNSHFYHNHYEDFDPVTATVSYSGQVANELVKNCLLKPFNETQERLPEVFIKMLVGIADNLPSNQQPFIPLRWENVSPPYHQVRYLESLGMSEENAVAYFAHCKDFHSLTDGSWKPRDMTMEQLEAVKQSIIDDGVEFNAKVIECNFDPETDISIWLKVVKEVPSVSDKVAKLLPREELLEHISNIMKSLNTQETSPESIKFLKSSLVLIKSLYQEESPVTDQVIRVTISELKRDITCINEDYIAFALEIFSKMLSTKDLPATVNCIHPNIDKIVNKELVQRPIESLITDEIFHLISQVESITNSKTATSITEILKYLTKEEKYRSQISESPVARALIIHSCEFTDNLNESHNRLKSLAVLTRRIFESEQVIRSNMDIELSKVLQHQKRTELPLLLRECSTLALRDNEVFSDLVSKRIRLLNYDGTKLLPTEMPVTVEAAPVEESEQSDKVELAPSPNGVIHAIISQLIIVAKKDFISTASESTSKDKLKQMFENKNFTYACFLLQILIELLGSYMQCKLEFITFSKKGTDVKPRSTALNVLIHQLIPTHLLTSTQGIENNRRKSISSLAKLAILALMSTPIMEKTPDMVFIRKFCTDLIIKAMKETSGSPQEKCSKLVDVFDLLGSLLSNKFRQVTGPLLNKSTTKNDAMLIVKCFFDCQMAGHITNILHGLDLNIPEVSKVIKSAVYALNLIGKLKSEHQEQIEGVHDTEEELPEMDDHDDAPNLFKNSTLGMYDIDYESDYEDEEMGDLGEFDELDVEEEVDSDEPESESDSDNDSEIDDDGEDDMEVDYDNVEIIEDYDSEEGFGSEVEEDFGSDEEEDGIDEEDDDESIYDEEELDDWIDAFMSDGGSDNEEETPETPREVRPQHDDDENEEEERDFIEVLRPSLNNNEFSRLVSRVMNPDGITGTIRILDGQMGAIGEAINTLIHGEPSPDPLSNFYIKSTIERWKDSELEFQTRHVQGILTNLIPKIVNNINESSIEFNKKRQEKMIQSIKEREEKKRKREEERMAREAEREQDTTHEDLDPVMVRIGDREVDISGTDIDPEFFEALPDDMREEVFTQHVRERRAHARTGSESREIDQDFLDALPDQIREEILQDNVWDEIDEDEPEEDEEIEPEEEQEDEDDEEEGQRTGFPSISSALREKPSKTASTVFHFPLVEKSGLSSLIRFLFLPQSLARRDNLHQTFKYVCYHKHARGELVNQLVSILYETVISHKPLDKIYQRFCKETGATLPHTTSTVIVADQVIDLLLFLLENISPLQYYFVTDHENPFIKKKKKSLSKKDKYQINILLKLLDNTLREDQLFIDLLSRTIQLATKPLRLFKTRDRVPFSIPVIPDHLLRQIIKLLTANDCPTSTFSRTIGAMRNLTSLPNWHVFSYELVDQATQLKKQITSELRQLTKNIELGDTSIITNNVNTVNQSKLLRVLTALDYMYEVDSSAETSSMQQKEKSFEVLKTMLDNISLGSLWDALSDCLTAIEEYKFHHLATGLLPLIESLMVVCKHSKVPEAGNIKYEAKKTDYTKEPLDRLFFSFTDQHKKLLNQMVRSNANLMSGPFGMLVKNQKVLEFDNKKNYFDGKLHENQNDAPTLAINVRREQVFLDSYRALFFKSMEQFRNSKLDINFKGESGIDAGGVTREWYQVLSRQMFNPDYALFTPVSANTYHPNRTSYINPEHLLFFKFIGKIIGKAIYDNCFLDCHFTRAIYKRILGRNLSLKDMETLDLEYYKSLMWMLENDITDVITEDFSVEIDDYGEKKVIDLIPGGRDIPVTEENKKEYVQKVVDYRLMTSVEEQMNHFLEGFHEIIPKDLISIFNEQELELLISGLPDIDVDDWQYNTVYNNYSPSSIQIQWFWRAVKSFDNEERAKLLQFATGTSKVPLNGFKELRGSNGSSNFNIHRDYGSTDRLPSSHTCFNQIDLPAYESYETLRGSLLMAIREGYEGFGLA